MSATHAIRQTDSWGGSKSSEAERPGVLHGEFRLILQTRQAQRLYMGRPSRKADPEKGLKELPFIPGTSGFATVLKDVQKFAIQDDPYADWTFVRLDSLADELFEKYAGIERYCDEMAKSEAGIEMSSFGSRSPVVYVLEYMSTYGYVSARLVARADRCLTKLQNLHHRSMITRNESESRTADIYRGVRRFHAIAREYKFTGTTRKDFWPAVTARGLQAIET